MRGYKLCKACGCPMLKKGQKRKGPHDYRHARGCPLTPKREREVTERWWRQYKPSENELNNHQQADDILRDQERGIR